MSSIGLYMIVKDEAEPLRRCLISTKDAGFDEIHVCQTWENEAVKRAIESFPKVTRHFRQWTDSFSESKNWVMDKCQTDWVMFLDSDDTIRNPRKLRKMVNKAKGNCIALWYNYYLDHQPYYKERIIRKGTWKWFNRVHEILIPQVAPFTQRFDMVQIDHHWEESDRITRNMKLCEMDYAEHKDLRTTYYMAISNMDMRRHKEADVYFKEYFSMQMSPQDRYMTTLLYARNLTSMGKHDEAMKVLDDAHQIFPTWNMAQIVKAGIMNKANDFMGAIPVLEKVFKEGTNIPAVYPVDHREYKEDAERLYRECRSKQNVKELMEKCTHISLPAQSVAIS